ncbi:uncharacterized protein LOC123980779 [Micropterus dolomieu]|uniref:uncharacterized protein LOC123980779 n=1 Tax=Micropterus dolomieu TaxID=147949 RepID=UPI001E8D018A|nr:uncharacterized protein LOC123980779 [Micropterus dolomieu]
MAMSFTFRSFTFQEMWMWYSLHKHLQADPQAGSDHERKMAQEAFSSVRQWLVMKEDDVSSKLLKRFRLYIVTKETEVIFEGWHKSCESGPHGLPKADVRWLKEDAERGLFQKEMSYENKHGNIRKRKVLMGDRMWFGRPESECPARAQKDTFLYRCGYSKTVRQICHMSGWYSMLTEVLACNACRKAAKESEQHVIGRFVACTLMHGMDKQVVWLMRESQ